MIWAVRLGSFLFLRVKQDGKDNRFTVMKTQFHWYIMTWTMGGLWVFLTMAAGLAAITSDVSIPLGLMAYIGLALWIFGFSIEVIADRQKETLKSNRIKKRKLLQVFGLGLDILTILVRLPCGWTNLDCPPSPKWLAISDLNISYFVYILLTKVSGIPMLENRGMKKWVLILNM